MLKYTIVRTSVANKYRLLRVCVYAGAHNNLCFVRGEIIMRIKEAIVKRFQQICDERKIKYNELATMSGVTPSTVYSMMDASRQDVSAVTVKKLCDGLEISTRTFYDAPIFENLEPEIQ